MWSAPINVFRRSLGLRISAWYALGFIGSFVLIASFASWITRRSGRTLDRTEIMQEFQQDAARCRQAGSERFGAEVRDQLPKVEPTLVRLCAPDGHTVLLVPALGESETELGRVDARLRQTFDQPGWQNIESHEGQSVWQVYGERMPDGYWLQVAKSDRRGRGTRRRLHEALVPVGTLVLLAALVGAAGLTAYALRPLHQLIGTTRGVIDSGDMTARVPTNRTGGEHELDELCALFNRMLARNETLIRTMDEALDNVAHDLRTPLTRLRGSAEAALRDTGATRESCQEALADAVVECEHVLTMLRAIMDISEARQGSLRLHLESIELHPLADDAADLYEHIADERGLRLRVDVPPDLRITADRVRLQQVVSNLVDNALKYSNAGGEVTISAGSGRLESGETWLSVRDQGVGIPPHDLPRIWDRLYRGDQSRSDRGNGLGLSLVKAIATAHGGRAEVESVPGQGSLFTVTLPTKR